MLFLSWDVISPPQSSCVMAGNESADVVGISRSIPKYRKLFREVLPGGVGKHSTHTVKNVEVLSERDRFSSNHPRGRANSRSPEFMRNQPITFFHHNAGSLNACKSFNADIVTLVGTRWRFEGKMMHDGFTIWSHPAKKDKSADSHAGEAICIRDTLLEQTTVKRMPWIVHRAFALRIYTRNHDVTIIAASGPGEAASHINKDNFWKKLR